MRRHLDLVVTNCVVLALSSAILSAVLLRSRNTMPAHPEWTVTKAALARELMGVRAYTSDGRALSGNRLNLGMWYGFQEVLSKGSFNLTQLDVKVGFEKDGYAVVLYDVRPDRFSGVRLSGRADLPSIAFLASSDGGFLSTTPLSIGSVSAPVVAHAVSVAFSDSAARISVDGRPAAAMPRAPGEQRVGFRGGQRASWVDDLVLRRADGSEVRETFDNNGRRLEVAVLLFLEAGILGFFLLRFFTRRGGMLARDAGLAVTVLDFCLLGVAVTGWAYQRYAPTRYPQLSPKQIQATETKQAERDEAKVFADVRQRLDSARASSSTGILFLGSSQTWGAGASRLDDIWVRQLERMLNAVPNNAVLCIDAGVSGLTSPRVLQFEKRVLALGVPAAAVVNLASNDVDTVVYRRNLDSIVTTLTTLHIPVVLLTEPNSPERRPNDTKHGDIAVKHRIIKEIGMARGVPVVDMQQLLAEQNRTGFLWWDFVHLTSYGQRLFAEHLRDLLPGLLHLPITSKQ